MAKKAQRFNKYPKEMIEALKEAYKNGNVTKNSIARDYNVPFNTVGTWIYKWNNPEKYPGQGQRKGRSKSSEINWKERYEILKNTRPSSRHNERESSVHQPVSERI